MAICTFYAPVKGSLRNMMVTEGKVLWITGLSGSGKTTLANAVCEKLKTRGIQPIMLDGDSMRETLAADSLVISNYDYKSREKFAKFYGRMAQLIANQGIFVIVSTISLFRSVFEWNRLNQPGYFEVFIDLPIERLKERDPKQIYHNFEKGNQREVVGIDTKYDIPKNPDMIFCKETIQHPNEMAEKVILSMLSDKKL